MFSLFGKQRQIDRLNQEAKTIADQATQRLQKHLDALRQRLKELDQRRLHIEQTTLPQLQNAFQRFKQATDDPFVGKGAFMERLAPLLQSAKEHRLEWTPLQNKKPSAIVAATVAAILTMAFLTLIAAIGTGKLLQLSTFISLDHWRTILLWLGGGALNLPNASPLLGALLLAGSGFLIGFLAYAFSMEKSATNNYKKAQSNHAAAQSYAQAIEAWCKEAHDAQETLIPFEKALTICDLYMDEYNAALKRILYTEGEVFEQLKPSSLRTFEQAIGCYKVITTLLALPLFDRDLRPDAASMRTTQEIEIWIEALIQERPLPSLETLRAQKSNEALLEAQQYSRQQQEDRKIASIHIETVKKNKREEDHPDEETKKQNEQQADTQAV